MEYPKYPRKTSLFKRPRRPSLFYRYPRLMHYGILGLAGLVLFSRPLYDMFFGPPGIPYEEFKKLSEGQLRELKEMRSKDSGHQSPK